MAVAYDNGVTVSSASNVSSLTSASWTISGSNTYLAAQIGSGAGTPVAPNACKWGGSGGTALTQVGSTQTFNTYFKHSVWELVGATAQSSTMYCSWPSNQDETALLAVSYTSVDQTTPKGTVATNQAESSASPTVTVTSVSGDVVVGFCYFANSNGGITSLTSSQTERKKIVTIGGLGYEALSIADTTASGTSTVMTWTGNTTRSFAAVGFALKAASSGSTYNDTLTESATVDATLANAATFASGLTESATVADSYSAGNVIGAALTESATLADDYAGAVSKDETLTESATLGDSLAAVQVFAEAPSEAVTLGESLDAGLLIAAVFSEGITLDATLAETISKDETLEESLTLADALSSTLLASATVSEGLPLDTTLAIEAVYNETLSEGLTLAVDLADEHIQGGVYNDTLTETLTLDDSYASTLSAAEALSEGITLDASFYTPPLGQSVRSGGGGGGRAWGWELDREVEEEMGVLLEGPPLTPATIEAVARRLDAPTESRIIGLKQPPVPAVSFDAAMVRRRRIRRRLLLLL